MVVDDLVEVAFDEDEGRAGSLLLEELVSHVNGLDRKFSMFPVLTNRFRSDDLRPNEEFSQMTTADADPE